LLVDDLAHFFNMANRVARLRFSKFLKSFEASEVDFEGRRVEHFVTGI